MVGVVRQKPSSLPVHKEADDVTDMPDVYLHLPLKSGPIYL